MKKTKRKTDKITIWGAMLSFFVLVGCANVFMAGVPRNADRHYPAFIGVKLITIKPAAIIKMGEAIDIHIPHDNPYGQKVADVPERTEVVIDHVVRKHNVENEIYDYVMGKIEIPGYSGFVTVGICDGRKNWPLDHCVDLSEYKIISR